VGSHSGVDDRLRDGGRRMEYKAVRYLGNSSRKRGVSEGEPWGGTSEKATVQYPSLNQGTRRCLGSITPRTDQGAPFRGRTAFTQGSLRALVVRGL